MSIHIHIYIDCSSVYEKRHDDNDDEKKAIKVRFEHLQIKFTFSIREIAICFQITIVSQRPFCVYSIISIYRFYTLYPIYNGNTTNLNI